MLGDFLHGFLASLGYNLGSFLDGIVGARARIALGDGKRWVVPLYVDLGLGDSDFTFQGIAGLGYAFSWCEIAAGWRYLYYDLSDKAIEDFSLSGPEIAFTFRF